MAGVGTMNDAGNLANLLPEFWQCQTKYAIFHDFINGLLETIENEGKQSIPVIDVTAITLSAASLHYHQSSILYLLEKIGAEDEIQIIQSNSAYINWNKIRQFIWTITNPTMLRTPLGMRHAIACLWGNAIVSVDFIATDISTLRIAVCFIDRESYVTWIQSKSDAYKNLFEQYIRNNLSSSIQFIEFTWSYKSNLTAMVIGIDYLGACITK